MSGIEALNSSNVAFSGKSKKAKKAEAKAKEEPKLKEEDKPSVGEKLMQPVKDEFGKRYGKDAEATPSLVADFLADNAIKVGIAVGGGLLLFAKSRKMTNGLTKGLKDNFQQIRQDSFNGKKLGIVKSSIETIKKTFKDIKANNLKDATKQAADAVKSGDTKFVNNLKNDILKPTEFKADSKLGHFIDAATGKAKKFLGKFGAKFDETKLATKIKGGLGKAGISDGASLADTAVATGAAITLSQGANGIADDVTSKDDKALARKARAEKLEGALNKAESVVNVLNMVAGE